MGNNRSSVSKLASEKTRDYFLINGVISHRRMGKYDGGFRNVEHSVHHRFTCMCQINYPGNRVSVNRMGAMNEDGRMFAYIPMRFISRTI